MQSTKRVKVKERIDCDTSRLYGTLDEAIKYLEEMRDKFSPHVLCLEENWYGYEDMSMILSYTRDETDIEFKQRAEKERRIREADAAEAQRVRENERLKAEIAFLKSKIR